MLKILGNIALAVATTILVLILGVLTIETFMYLKEKPNHEENWHDPNTQFDPELGWSPISNRQIEHEWGRISSNALGFRSEELDPAKERIVLLGDSVIWGYGMDDEKIASFFLQKKLESSNDQIANLGVSGYDLGQYYLFLKRHIAGLKPVSKVILVIQTGFDLGETRMSYSYGKRKPHHVIEDGKLSLKYVPIKKYCLRNLYSMSHLLSKAAAKWPVLHRMLYALAGDHIIKNGKELLDVATRLVEEMESLARKNGASFHILLSPSFREFSELSVEHRFFKELCSTKSYDCVDFLGILKDQTPFPRGLYIDPNHYNEQGNAILARTLHDEFVLKS